MRSTKNIYKPILALILLVFTVSCGSMRNTEEDLVADAEEAQAEIVQEHPEIAENFDDAVGYAIFPNVGKGAYIIGGASGNGVVYENGNVAGYADLKQVDVGLQAGGKAFVEIIFFETEAALEDFKEGGFELSANASAVVLEEGVSRSVEFRDGVGVVTMPKGGAMAGVSVGGQRFDYYSAD